jgi:hypothetical protein
MARGPPWVNFSPFPAARSTDVRDKRETGIELALACLTSPGRRAELADGRAH